MISLVSGRNGTLTACLPCQRARSNLGKEPNRDSVGIPVAVDSPRGRGFILGVFPPKQKYDLAKHQANGRQTDTNLSVDIAFSVRKNP